jgi:hypothetical protein
LRPGAAPADNDYLPNDFTQSNNDHRPDDAHEPKNLHLVLNKEEPEDLLHRERAKNEEPQAGDPKQDLSLQTSLNLKKRVSVEPESQNNKRVKE